MSHDLTAPPEHAPKDPQQSRYELLFGITITLFAAVLAVNELGGGKYGDDEIKLTNERSSRYLWYQSKGIKATLAEGQRETMKLLLATGGLNAAQAAGFDRQVVDLDHGSSVTNKSRMRFCKALAPLRPIGGCSKSTGKKAKSWA